ncbi:asparagine synthetase B family protein [Pseudoxanthomonas composti]|uniref:asparagine synthase (glutamine-hydrolyzing) n=1 Tax=Pseudoxanthomonas composti TaxID=2137479 RepID=A0A4Q1JTK9_9GAMM|nr:asparagine synthase C-terminal domain-containing protein [Pseudoxanthomonas composti]RXR00886.1 hypothetical protein EPA99_16510 [Pseudoxanthomonas composti]
MTVAVTGDFIVAYGPRAQAWLDGLEGFQPLAGPAPGTIAAVRGDVHRGQTAAGTRWVALADLIEGQLEDGAQPAIEAVASQWRGRFAQVAWGGAAEEAFLATTDHFGSLPLYWYARDGHFAIATDLRLLLDAPGVRRQPDLQAVYHYLNFACIPAPLTICADIRRVMPGTRLQLSLQGAHADRYYLPEYPADLHGGDHALAKALRERMIDSVRAHRPDKDMTWGCFLSGGTDSSSITSILASDGQVKTCSIGFEEAGYDELEFARIASRACGAEPYTERVDRDRALDMLDTVIQAYDQPFGNASAVPTLACAQLGQQLGMTVMLGGDGGDEIFGGNERYAKDKLMERFYRLPAPLKALGVAIGNAVGGGSNWTLNRVRNYTRRGAMPNPDRFYQDDAFASEYYEALLTPAFRAQVDRDASLDYMRQTYAEGGPVDPLNQIMRLDLAMAIAQNDLVKVHRACRHHGVAARFPYLDKALVAFCGRLPADAKLRGTQKRWLFKQAMVGILPTDILKKPKQGFGLPIAVWMKEPGPMQTRVRQVLLDERTQARGWIEPAFVSRLVEMHMAGGADHSAALWQLLVLELWMRKYFDARSAVH